jgi:hypothetical protein
MTFDTFWAAIVEAIEVRTGEDLARKDIVIGMKLSQMRELIRQVYELGVNIGKGDEE